MVVFTGFITQKIRAITAWWLLALVIKKWYWLFFFIFNIQTCPPAHAWPLNGMGLLYLCIRTRQNHLDAKSSKVEPVFRVFCDSEYNLHDLCQDHACELRPCWHLITAGWASPSMCDLPADCPAFVQRMSSIDHDSLEFKAIAGDDAVFNIRTTVVVVIVDIDPAQI